MRIDLLKGNQVVTRLQWGWKLLGVGLTACMSLGPVQLPSASVAETGSVLAVPAGKSTMHLMIDLPVENVACGKCLWRLVDMSDGKNTIPIQVAPAPAPYNETERSQQVILAQIPPVGNGLIQPRHFRLEKAKASDVADNRFQFVDVDENSLKLLENGKPVFVYNHGIITDERVPQDDSRRSRGCYIHPLWGLSGEVLTDDFPRDHYHHRGVFWAWPHVGVGKKHYDLWMCRGIAHKFVRWLDRQTGPVAAILGVENGWFVGDKMVMIERVWLRAFASDDTERALDLDFTWIPVDEPITLRGAEGKSYGGLTVRFAVEHAKDAAITVPSGPAKEDLKEAPLAWVDLTARFHGAAGPSGAAIFIPKDHPDYPPTWLTRHYGPLCLGWPGVKGKTFAPGELIRLRYRLWLHKDAPQLDTFRHVYDDYTAGLQAKWE